LAKLIFDHNALKPTSLDRARCDELCGAFIRENSRLLGEMEGPEMPPTRPTLAMTHPELGHQGETLIIAINKIFEEGEESGRLSDLALRELPDLLASMVEFIGAALSTRGPNDGVAHWAEQTFRAVQRIEKRIATNQQSTEKGKETRTWAAVASTPPRPSSDEKALREVKVRITDTQERKAL
jgi:hypothetical protein